MSNIPYTTAASDFLKLVEFKDDDKSDLIDFAATDFLTLRESLINYVKAVYPLDYNLFSESDLGMMFIELVSYMGSVLSMKADMLAHESFLKTAKNPVNVRKLLQLIGVKFRGPSSSAAQAVATVIGSGGVPLTIPVASRVFTKKSPEDGEIVNYTLYQTDNGQILDIAATNEINLEVADSDLGTGQAWSNLVLVEGALVEDSGTFADTDVLKSVSLSRGPVIDGSVQVFIDAGDSNSEPYREVASLLSTSSSDQAAFELIYNGDYTATVLFGDGVSGKIPPTGSTYRILYRVGGGTRGNAATSQVRDTIVSDEGASLTVENILPFTGGNDAETIDHARKYAQLTFRQQDRYVSLDDYTTVGNTFKSSTGASAKAIAATRKAYSSANLIDLYVVEVASDLQLQKASIAFKSDLLKHISTKKMITDEVVVVDGLIRTIDLNMEVSLDRRFENKEGSLKAAISQVILNYFNVNNREFGQDFIPELVSREVFQKIPEVRLAKILNYSEPVSLEFNEILQLNNFYIGFNYV